jgi:hypothetical protein
LEISRCARNDGTVKPKKGGGTVKPKKDGGVVKNQLRRFDHREKSPATGEISPLKPEQDYISGTPNIIKLIYNLDLYPQHCRIFDIKNAKN